MDINPDTLIDLEQAEINEALAKMTEADPDFEGSLVSKWVMVWETIDEDGDRSLHMINERSMTAWDRDGILNFVLEYDGED